MALKYRLPVEDVLNRFTSEEQSRVSSFALKKIVADESFNSEHFAFNLNDFSKAKLTEAGIPLSPHSYLPHSHPVCKTLENHFLYNIIPNKIDDSFYFVGIKGNKLGFLKKRKKNLENIIAINRYVTSVDKFRYSNDFVVRNSGDIPGLKSGHSHNSKFCCSKTLKDLIPECVKIKGRNFMIHDEVHYWSISDMSFFLEATQAQMVLATVVIPPELLIGATESLNPWCYGFEKNGKDLFYFPDGRQEAFYTQPLDCIKWLKINQIQTFDGGVYNVDLVHSCYSHHLLCITRGNLVLQKYRYFSDFQAVNSKELANLGGSIRNVLPISSEVVTKIYLYLRTLKKPDIQSAMAKLRQLVENVTPIQIKFFEAFSKAIINSYTDDGMLVPNWFEKFSFFFQNMLPKQVAQLCHTYRKVSLDKFISDMHPLFFRIETCGMGLIDEFKIDYYGLNFSDSFVNPLVNIQGDWDGSNRFIDLHFKEDNSDDSSHTTQHDKFGPSSSSYDSEGSSGTETPFSTLKFNMYSRKGDMGQGKKRKNERDDPIIDQFSFYSDFESSRHGDSKKNFTRFYNSASINPLNRKTFLLDGESFMAISTVIIKILQPWIFCADRGVLNVLNQLLNKCQKKVEPSAFAKMRNLIVDTVVCKLNCIPKSRSDRIKRVKKGPTFDLLGFWWFHCRNRANQRFISSHGCRRPVGSVGILMRSLISTISKFSKACAKERNKIINLRDKSPFPIDETLGSECFNPLIYMLNDHIFNYVQGVYINLGELKVRAFVEPFESGDQPLQSLDMYDVSLLTEVGLAEGGCGLMSSMLDANENVDRDGEIHETGCGEVQSVDPEKEITLIKRDKESPNLAQIVANIGEATRQMATIETEYNTPLEIKLEPVKYTYVEVTSEEDNTFGGIIQDQLIFANVDVEGGILQSIYKLLDKSKRTSLKGRDCFFFSSCPCIEYGHDAVKYISNPWSLLLSQLLPNDGIDYNTCLLQIYEENAKLNFHADDEKCYDDHPILTINLKGSAKVLFKEKYGVNSKEVCSFVIHDGLSFKMPSGFQRKYKHSINAMTAGRLSLTFRIQNKDCVGRPIKHNCGVIEKKRVLGSSVSHELNGNLAFYHIFEPLVDTNQADSYLLIITHMLGFSLDVLRSAYTKRAMVWKMQPIGKLLNQLEGREELDMEFFASCSTIFGLDQTIFFSDSNKSLRLISESSSNAVRVFIFKNQSSIFSICMPRNGCVIKALARSLERKETDIIRVLSTEENCDLLREISEGNGVDLDNLEAFFKVFSISARVQTREGVVVLNSDGSKPRFFQVDNGHIEYVKGSLGDSTASGRTLEKKPMIFKDLIDSCLIEILQSCDMLNHTIDIGLAKLLADSLHDGTTGVISDGFFSGKKNLIELFEDNEIDFTRKVHCLVGVPGSGKTSFYKQKIFNKTSLRVVIVSPRRALIDQIREDIVSAIEEGKRRKSKRESEKGARSQIPRNFKLLTFEQFLQSCNRFTNSLIILDEAQLFPNGYLDLACALLQKDNNILVTGDPLQSHYDSSKDRHILGLMENDLVKLLGEASYSYNIKSWRFENSNFEGRLPFHLCAENVKFQEDHMLINGYEELSTFDPHEFDAYLVASFEEKSTVQAYMGKDVNCLTFGESTGLNFDQVAVICSSDAIRTDENRWLTALTRAKKNIAFVNDMGNSFKELAVEYSGRHLQKFLSKTATTKDTIAALPGDPILVDSFKRKIGKDEEVKELKLSGDPWLKPLIFLGQTEDIEEPEECTFEDPELNFKTHIPNTNLEAIRSRWVNRIKARENREMRVGGEISVQFSEDHHKGNGTVLTNAAERYESIYPRHHGSDSVTFLMAVKKRLRFSNPAKEMRRFLLVKSSGRKFLNLFRKFIPLNNKLEPLLMEEALREFEEKKTSKSSATIENHSGRSEMDWARDQIFLFMKSQHCTKYSNRFCDAKAGQTLACFHHAVLCRFAPFIRYIEKKVFRVLPKNYYVHSGKAIEDLDEWVKHNNFGGMCTESDYEAFDASQDQFIMAFEVELMKFLQLPSDLIEDYIFIKTHLGCKLGGFAIMRFTGEASTFLFNTLANMLFTFMNYDLNGKESICFAGDDMCANSALKKTNKFESTLKKIRLKAKVEFTDKPSFCGWQLTPNGVFKKPQLVLERICIARERDNLVNCLDSYAIEVSYAYRMGEILSNYLDEEGLDNHYECVRFIVKKKHLLKSSVAELFTNNCLLI